LGGIFWFSFDVLNFDLLAMNGRTRFALPNQYLDVDDILATQERVMCNFETTVLNMGMFQSS